MITKVDAFILECDNCQDVFTDYDGYSIFVDENSANEKADLCDWLLHNNKRYCSQCYSTNEHDEILVDDTRKDLHKTKV